MEKAFSRAEIEAFVLSIISRQSDFFGHEICDVQRLVEISQPSWLVQSQCNYTYKSTGRTETVSVHHVITVVDDKLKFCTWEEVP